MSGEEDELRFQEESLRDRERDGDPAEWDQFFLKQDLDVHLITDFIDTWKLALDHQTDAHWSFKEMTALFLISLFGHWKWTFLDFSRMMDDDTGEGLSGLFFLNLWVMILGKSRIARKTTVFRKVIRIVRAIGRKFDVMGDNDEIQQVELMLEHEFNPASFVQSMNQREADGFSYATWIDDEVSRFYEQMATATYMAGIAPALSKIYDPLDGYSRFTIARGRESIDRSYFTVLTASTLTLPQLFSEREIMQGFLNRFMFVLDDPKDRKDRIDPENASLNIIETYGKIRDWLNALQKCNPTSLYILPNSPQAKYVRDYEKKVWNIIRDDEVSELYQGYMGNMPDFLIKIASLYRMSRIPHHDLVNTYQKDVSSGIAIEMQDLERAMVLVELLYENFVKVVRISRKKTRLGTTYIQDSDAIVVYEAIEQTSDEKLKGFATRTKVLNKTGINAKQLDKIANDLVERECIRIEWNKPKRGRPTQLYKAVNPPI